MTNLSFLDGLAICKNMVGSRYTVNPPPTDTDEDWLVLIPEKNFQNTIYALGANGFSLDNPNEHYRPENSQFNSWRGPNKLNLIVTSDVGWHNRFLAATSLAKKYNLKTRPERVQLFQATLYGLIYDIDQFTEKPAWF